MMLDVANSGEPGEPASISPELFERFNVQGSGHFVISQNGDMPSFQWIPHEPFQPDPVAGSGWSGNQAILSEGLESFESDLRALENRAWLAPGSLGETVSRLTGPVQFIRKLMDFWQVSYADTACLLGRDPEDVEYVSAILEGGQQLRGRDVQDRIVHLFHIRRILWSLFRDLEVENEWLREQHSMLNGKSPLSLMLEGSMENLLLARDYVESAAGVR